MIREMTVEIRGIPGLSGCRVEVVQKDNAVYVRKSAEDVQYRERLKKQAAKQRYFHQTNTLPYILIPEVVEEHDEIDGYSFDMPFFRSQDYVSFFQEATKQAVDAIAANLLAYLEHNIQSSPEAEIPRECLRAKYDEVRERTADNAILRELRDDDIWKETAPIFAGLPRTLKMPVGRCHGDLTFSNILINRSDKKLVLVDWLDNFIETPLQDMVKLRQDTKYGWSLALCQTPCDKTKILLIMAYLDKLMDEHFRRYPFYRSYYLPFQTLNFLRILPYAKERALVSYVKATIHTIVKSNGL